MIDIIFESDEFNNNDTYFKSVKMLQMLILEEHLFEKRHFFMKISM